MSGGRSYIPPPLTRTKEKELREYADLRHRHESGYMGSWIRVLLGEIDRLRAALKQASA